MKNTIKLITLLCAPAFLSGCVSYTSNPGKMDELEGTYELSQYTYKPDEGEQIDFIKEKKAKSYLVVNSSGYGYTTYEDNEQPFYVDSVRYQFIYSYDDNNEKTDLISKINYTRGISDKAWSPREGRLELGFNKKAKTLNITALNTKFNFGDISVGLKYTMHVTYKKVNTATDLSYVNKVYKTTLSTIPFETKILDNTWYRYDMFDSEVNPFIYNYVKFDVKNNKMLTKMALKSDEQQTSNDNLPFAVTAEEEGYKFSYNNGQFTIPLFTEANIKGVISQYLNATMYYDNDAHEFVNEPGENTREVGASLVEYSQTDAEIEELINQEYQAYMDTMHPSNPE